MASPDLCYFVVHECKLPGKNADLFLVGDVFLRHFYSVYDFENDQVGLGVNIHSEGKVQMYKPGERKQDSGSQSDKSSKNINSGNKETRAIFGQVTSD